MGCTANGRGVWPRNVVIRPTPPTLLTRSPWIWTFSFATTCLRSSRTIAKPVELQSYVSTTRHSSYVAYLTSAPVSDATHIFDGLNAFPTHIAHMRFGSFVTEPTPWPLDSTSSVSAAEDKSTLYHVALQWLSEDRAHRRELEKQGRKVRGARRDQVCSITRRLVAADLTMISPHRQSPPIPRNSTASKIPLYSKHGIILTKCCRYDYSH